MVTADQYSTATNKQKEKTPKNFASEQHAVTTEG